MSSRVLCLVKASCSVTNHQLQVFECHQGCVNGLVYTRKTVRTVSPEVTHNEVIFGRCKQDSSLQSGLAAIMCYLHHQPLPPVHLKILLCSKLAHQTVCFPNSHAVLSAWQVSRLKGVRERLGLPAEERGPEEVEVAAGVHGLSQIELDAFVDLAVQRYQTKRMDPGNTLCSHLTVATHPTCSSMAVNTLCRQMTVSVPLLNNAQ